MTSAIASHRRPGGDRPRVYFVHIPKTAGITLKAFLENHYAAADSLAVDQRDARRLPGDELNGYRLFTGHYGSEVLDALDARPDAMLVMVREPVARFRSWAAHGRRSHRPENQAVFAGRSDLDVLRRGDVPDTHQAYWLARAIRDGSESTRVPRLDEIDALLGRTDAIGLTEEIDRYKQLLAYRFGWPAPELGWHLNRRPDEVAVDPAREIEDAEIRSHLEVDVALYAEATSRFWAAYAAMLTAIDPDGVEYTSALGRAVPVDQVQVWLRRRYESRPALAEAAPVEACEITAQDPIAGEGWWWRERPTGHAYRWTGPAGRATVCLPPLVAGGGYRLDVECTGAADWATWDGLRVDVNGRRVRAVRERFGPFTRGEVSLRVRADVPAAVVEGQRFTHLALIVPEAKPSPAKAAIMESEDTAHADRRLVGVAVHRVRIRRVDPAPSGLGG